MISVALIGMDGAGKTSVANALPSRLQVKARRVYLGQNLESSNVLLPTSALLRFVRRQQAIRRFGGGAQASKRARQELASNRSRNIRRGSIGTGLRLVHRLSEGMFRALWVAILKIAGFVVICDRHIYYENLSRRKPGNLQARDISDRLFFWFVDHVLPRPDLVVLLDVPAETAFERKGELSLEEYRDRRRVLKTLADGDNCIVVVDATPPLDTVVENVARSIETRVSNVNETRLSQV